MKTITFYSYKGGVGRSLILANIAQRLVEFGKTVCLIDFDLEAPGLQAKFGYDLEESFSDKGLLDFINDCKVSETVPQNIENYGDFLNVTHRRNAGKLFLIPAGPIHDPENYWQKLSDLNWKELFYSKNGRGYEIMMHLKALIELQLKPDYILVDSRTGITEISGITISVLADEIVLVSANNSENIFGIKLILNSISKTEKDNFKAHLVMSRIPFSDNPNDRQREFESLEDWQDQFSEYGIDKIHLLHSDRELEDIETLKISDQIKEDAIAIENDYKYFFDYLIQKDFTEADIVKYENWRKANLLHEQSLSEETPKKVITLLNEAIKFDDSEGVFFFDRGRAYIEIKNAKKAIDDFEKAIALTLNPQYFSFYINYLKSTEQYDDAINYITKQIEKGEFGRAFLLSQRYMIYEKLMRFSDALNDSLEAMKINPNSLSHHYHAALAYFNLDDLSTAEDLIRHVVQRNSMHFRALLLLAKIYLRNNSTAEFYLFLEQSLLVAKRTGLRSNAMFKSEISQDPFFLDLKDEPDFEKLIYKYNIKLK